MPASIQTLSTNLPVSDENESDSPSTQLQKALSESITCALSIRRPLLTHLNADTTWLLSLPYPPTAVNPKDRIYYHILIDPWLKGGQSDVAKFFSQQWHKEPSSVQSIAEVEEVIKGIESAARGADAEEVEVGEGLGIVVDTTDGGLSIADAEVENQGENWIDTVVVSHEFTDHMHQDTLLEVPSSIPILATSKAASSIGSWKHFASVDEIPRFHQDWRDTSRSTLPEWLGVSRIAYAGQDLLYYHAAVMFAFSLDGGNEAEAVIYTPHGISPSDISPLSTANPRIQTLALLHGLQDIKLGAQLNMGAHNGLKVLRVTGAKYWIGTHDEVKRGGGLVSWFLDRKFITLGEAIAKEQEERGSLDGTEMEGMGEVRFEEVGNGMSLILE